MRFRCISQLTLCVVVSAVLRAQDPAPAPATTQTPSEPSPVDNKGDNRGDKPRDTSSDATQPASRPPADAAVEQTTDSNASTIPEYSGPAVLSRSFGANTPTIPRNVKFRPFFGLAGVYASGLTGDTLSSAGGLDNRSSYGAEANFGIGGRRYWRKDVLSLDYRGSYFRYTPTRNYNGSNNLLTLDFRHQASRHVDINFSESAAIYSNNYALLNGVGASDLSIGNTNFAASPNTQILDNNTISLNTGVDVVYHKSARLSIDFGGAGFLVRRASSSLYGTTGYQARGDVNYRITRRTSVGPYYAFSHYEFNKGFGGSDIHTVGLNYSVALTRNVEIKLRGGVSIVETLGLLRVAIDPVIAAILGQSFGVQTVYRKNTIPDISAALTRKFRHGGAGLQYNRGITPGNGLYLTSQREGIYGNIDYDGFRSWNLGIGAGRDSLSSLSQTLGQFRSYVGRATLGHRLGRVLTGTTAFEFRRYNIQGVNFLRDQFRITVGVTYNPGERPLSIW